MNRKQTVRSIEKLKWINQVSVFFKTPPMKFFDSLNIIQMEEAIVKSTAKIVFLVDIRMRRVFEYAAAMPFSNNETLNTYKDQIEVIDVKDDVVPTRY